MTDRTIAVIGATGRTGRPLVQDLLDRGATVRVLVRDPSKLGNLVDRVAVVTGASTDPAALTELVQGADTVVSALGPTNRESTLQTDTARALLPVISAAGVRRFVGVSGAGIDIPGDQKGTRDKIISFMIQKLGGAVAKDKATEYQVFAGSDIDWTLVRPPRLTDGPATGKIQHDAHRPGKSTSITRADLANFVADVAMNGSYSRQAPFVCGA